MVVEALRGECTHIKSARGTECIRRVSESYRAHDVRWSERTWSVSSSCTRKLALGIDSRTVPSSSSTSFFSFMAKLGARVEKSTTPQVWHGVREGTMPATNASHDEVASKRRSASSDIGRRGFQARLETYRGLCTYVHTGALRYVVHK